MQRTEHKCDCCDLSLWWCLWHTEYICLKDFKTQLVFQSCLHSGRMWGIPTGFSKCSFETWAIDIRGENKRISPLWWPGEWHLYACLLPYSFVWQLIPNYTKCSTHTFRAFYSPADNKQKSCLIWESPKSSPSPKCESVLVGSISKARASIPAVKELPICSHKHQEEFQLRHALW